MVMPEFKKFNAEALGISVDNVWSHLAFAKDRKLNFPLLADFEPKGEISRKFGAYKEKIGESARALFVLDEQGGQVEPSHARRCKSRSRRHPRSSRADERTTSNGIQPAATILSAAQKQTKKRSSVEFSSTRPSL